MLASAGKPDRNTNQTQHSTMKAAQKTLKTITLLTLCTMALAARADTFFDDFESYAVGSNLHGQGGWVGWANDPSAGALVSSNFAFSPVRSVAIAGASDLTHTLVGATNGSWVFTVRQFIPSTSTGTNYVILLNTFQPPFGNADLNWSVQIQNNLDSGRVISDLGGGATLPMVKDQWVEVKCLINLASNTVSEFYNGQLLSTHAWRDGTGLNQIQALDLFANNAAPVYYDDVRLVPAGLSKVTYTSSTTCNAGNTGWTIVTVCQVGDNASKLAARLGTGVQFSPASSAPTATLTDAAGNPIMVNGAVVTLVPSASLSSAVTARYGTLSSNHVWRAFETSVDLPAALAGSSASFNISYAFPAPVRPEGATWVSDDGPIRYNATVVDGFNWVPAGLSKVTYTSSTTCNAGNTGWTIVTVCQVGDNASKLAARLGTGVQFSPASSAPTATLTDAAGNPIMVNGAVVTLVPSASLSSAVTARYGTLSSNHVWRAFETSVDLPAALAGSSASFNISYAFPAPVRPEGATWVSDDGPIRYNATVVDGFEVFGLVRPTLTASVSGGSITIQWSGGGVLQQSSDLVTWSDLPAATSPYTAQVSASPKKFYRVRQ